MLQFSRERVNATKLTKLLSAGCVAVCMALSVGNLIGGLEHVLFFRILGIIIPIYEVIFFRGLGTPPTSNI